MHSKERLHFCFLSGLLGYRSRQDGSFSKSKSVSELLILASENFLRSEQLLIPNRHSRPDEAWEVIRRLHHTSNDEDTLSKKEFYQMQKQLESDRKVKRGKWEIFATAPNRKRSMIGFGLMFGNQFTVSLLFA